MFKMEMWRQTNNELVALYQDEVTFGTWQYLWDRFLPSRPGRGPFQPRIVARWYVGDLYAV